MPRSVNHDDRKVQIAQTAWRITADEGRAAATIRRVAAELGASTTIVTQAFASKADMMSFAYKLRLDSWMRGREEAAAGLSDPSERLRTLLLDTCPMDDDGFSESRVWIEALATPTPAPRVQSAITEYNDWWKDLLSQTLAALGASPELAYPLQALAWGINAAAVEDPAMWPPSRIEATIDVVLDSLGLVTTG